MLNLFQQPTELSRMHGVHFACEVLKQVQHDVWLFYVSNTPEIIPGISTIL